MTMSPEDRASQRFAQGTRWGRCQPLPLVGAVHALAMLLLSSSATQGSLPLPRMGGVSERDQLAHSIGAADRIVIATLEAHGRVRVKRLNTDPRPSILVDEWRMVVRQWLKGKPAGASLRFTIGHNRFFHTPPELAKGMKGQTFLLFLKEPPPPREEGKVTRFNPPGHWAYVLDADPAGYRAGAALTSTSEQATISSQVAAILHQQSAAELTRASTVIVEGIPNLNHKQLCTPGSESTACTPLAVIGVLKGDVAADTIYMYSRIPFYHKSKVRTIVFLRQTGDNLFEVFGGPAGVITFDDGQHDKHGKTPQQWRAELRALQGPGQGGR